jgi:hypothetical protein
MAKPEKNIFLRIIDSFKAFFSGLWEDFMSLIGRRKATGSSSTETVSTGAAPPATTITSASSAANDVNAEKRAKLDSKIKALEERRYKLRRAVSSQQAEKAQEDLRNLDEILFPLKAERYALDDSPGKSMADVLKNKAKALLNDLEAALKEISPDGDLGKLISWPNIKYELEGYRKNLDVHYSKEDQLVRLCRELEIKIKDAHNDKNDIDNKSKTTGNSSSPANDINAEKRAQLDKEIRELEVQRPLKQTDSYKLFALQAERYALDDSPGKSMADVLRDKAKKLLNELETALKEISPDGDLDKVPGSYTKSMLSTDWCNYRRNFHGEDSIAEDRFLYTLVPMCRVLELRIKDTRLLYKESHSDNKTKKP